ncbi:hypothetical protein R3P38DRAFT_3288133, partial [Favolaschia claudopus]
MTESLRYELKQVVPPINSPLRHLLGTFPFHNAVHAEQKVGVSSRKEGGEGVVAGVWKQQPAVRRRHCQTTATPPSNESIWSDRSQAHRLQ